MLDATHGLDIATKATVTAEEMDMDSTTAPRQLISLVRFTTGRRIYVLRQVRTVAVPLNQPAMVTHIDEAIAHDRATLDLEIRWRTRGEYGRRHAPEAQNVDNRVDTAVGSLRDVAFAYVRAAPPGDAKRKAAEYFLDKVFPDGVAPITGLPFVDELAAVEHILDIIATDLGAQVAELSLEHLVALLTSVTDEYRAVLDRGPDMVEFPQVQESRDIGQDNLLELMAMILGAFPKTRDPAHRDARERLPGPIMAQQQAIRRYLRDRAQVPDVDPDAPPDETTGEPPIVVDIDPPIPRPEQSEQSEPA